ncbi:hypothetical protein AGMMS50267_02350 [Spirochaetia bacterium]|nr:hypothetical protein AGMMS50267_02350 [Spirochaetia bacterium]
MIRRRGSVFTLILMIALLSSCELFPGLLKSDDVQDTTGTFTAYSMATKKFYPVKVDLLAENEVCLVYGEQSAGISQITAQAIALEYKNHIYSQITGAFGDFTDVDGNGKIILFLLDIKDGYDATMASSYVAGYFHPLDMIASGSNSNRADMLYLDTNPGKPGSTEFYNTLAHELQHLINFSIRYNRGASISQDVWIDEGLSSAAEYIYSKTRGIGYNQGKIDFFNTAATQNSAIREGNNFFTWTEDAYVYDEYVTAYLFFQWLRIHAAASLGGDGTGIYKAIINSAHLNETAVTDAVKTIDPKLDSWDKILEAWILANYINAKTGLYGYRGEISTNITPSSYSTVKLYPGEGVFSALSRTGFFIPSNADTGVRYIKVSKAGELTYIDDWGSYTGTSGDHLLTFNTSLTDRKTGHLTGAWSAALPVDADPSPAARSVDTPQKPYPIDFRPTLPF